MVQLAIATGVTALVTGLFFSPRSAPNPMVFLSRAKRQLATQHPRTPAPP
jgi:hypothetical protein